MAKATTTYNGTPAQGLYLVIQRLADGHAWDAVAGALEAYDAASLADYDLLLSNLGGDLWGVDVPDALPAGAVYAFTFYERQGASPAATDPVLPSSYNALWTGTDATTGSSGYVGNIVSAARLRLRFGTTHIAGWSNSSGGTAEDPDAVQWAIEQAEGHAADLAAGSLYALPFVLTGASWPAALVELVLVRAAWLLYTRKGLSDEKKGGDLSGLLDRAEKDFKRYLPGHPRALPGVLVDPAVSLGARTFNPHTGRVSDGTTSTYRAQTARHALRWINGYGWDHLN